MSPAVIIALISALPLLLQFISSIVIGVQNAADQAKADGSMTAPIAGPDKLASALSIFKTLWPTITATGTGAKLAEVTTPDELAGTVTSLINEAVSFFNTIGKFAKSAAPVVPAA